METKTIGRHRVRLGELAPHAEEARARLGLADIGDLARHGIYLLITGQTVQEFERRRDEHAQNLATRCARLQERAARERALLAAARGARDRALASSRLLDADVRAAEARYHAALDEHAAAVRDFYAYLETPIPTSGA